MVVTDLSILDNLIEGVMVLDRSYHVTFMNKSAVAQNWFGEHLLHKNLRDEFPQLHNSRMHKGIELAFTERRSDRFVFEFTGDGGIIRFFDISIYADDDHVLLFTLDVTRQVEAEIVMKNENSTLQRLVNNRTRHIQAKTRELEELTFSASYELNRSIRKLQNKFSNIKSGIRQTDEELKNLLREMDEELIQMDKFIVGLRRLQDIGANTSISNLNLHQIYIEERDKLVREYPGKTVRFESDLLPSVKGYEKEMRLIFRNLIDNAIKFSKPAEVCEVSIFADSDDREFSFTIQDMGIGFDEKYSEKIFLLFQKLTGTSFGNGIGLTKCRKAVELHNGRIEVESEPGTGSRFTVTIPRL